MFQCQKTHLLTWPRCLTGQRCWWRGRGLQESWMENCRATWWSTAHLLHSRSVWDTYSHNQTRRDDFWACSSNWRSPSSLLLTVCYGYRIGHWAVNQSVCPPVQCVFSSVCLYRGGARTLDPHTDSDTYCSWWVTRSVKTTNFASNAHELMLK